MPLTFLLRKFSNLRLVAVASLLAAACGPGSVELDVSAADDSLSAAPSVISFTLVNTSVTGVVSGSPVSGFDPIPPGATIDLSKVGKTLSIRANTDPTLVGSVKFGLDTSASAQLENRPPYALCGDNGAGTFGTCALSIGAHVVTGTAFTGSNGTGTSGTKASLSFTVVAGSSSVISGFTLVNASVTNVVSGASVPGFDPLANGATVDLGTTGSALSIRANLTSAVGSVKFGLDSNPSFRIENVAPFALCGDNGQGSFANCNLSAGAHTLTATPFSGANGSGTAGIPVTLSFTVVAPAVGGGPAPSGFVTRIGKDLFLDGKLYKFTGLNLFGANSSWLGWGGYGVNWNDGDKLATALTSWGPGKEAFRAWFWQGFTNNNGKRDWSRFDKTLQVAASKGYRVIATLSDQGGSGQDYGGWKTVDWYTSGYKSIDPGALTSYRDFVAEVVTRYRDNPTVLMWQMVNEAETSYPAYGSCVTGGAAALRGWAHDIAQLIKSIDTNHLVSIGTIGSGQCGATGNDYKLLHDSPNVDLCEYHDYSADSPIPGDSSNGMQLRIDQCKALNKPLFVGEAGIKSSRTDRPQLFDAKLKAQFPAGVVGFVVWSWDSSDGYQLLGISDPSLAVLGLY